MQNQELDLSEYSSALRRAVSKMVVVGLLFAGLAVLATYVVKPAWEAEASLLMDSKPQVAPSIEALFDQSANPLTVLRGILKSRAATERIAKATGVDRKDLEAALEVKIANDENQLRINVKWKGQGKAIDIVQASLRTLDSMKKEIGFSVAARQAKQLESAIETKSKELANVEQQVQDYQKQMKSLIDPSSAASISELMRQEKQLQTDLKALDLQIGAAKDRARRIAGASVELPSGLPNATDWQKRLSKAEYDLRIAKINQGDGSPVVIRLQKELQETRAQLEKEILNYFKSFEQSLDTDVGKLEAQRLVTEMRLNATREMASNAPKEARELNRLVREAAILNSVVTTLRQQYELKKLDEIGDVSWSVLEPPHLTEEEPVNKKFLRNGFVGFVIGAFLVALLAMFGQRSRSFSSGA